MCSRTHGHLLAFPSESGTYSTLEFPECQALSFQGNLWLLCALYLWTHVIAEEEAFFHRTSKMFVFFQLFDGELKSAPSCHGSLTTCKCAAGYALMSSHAHLHSPVYPLPSILLQKVRLFSYIMESPVFLTVNCIFGRWWFFRFSLFACPQFHSDVLCISLLTSIYLLLRLISRSSHSVLGKLVLFGVLPLCSGQYLFGLLRISYHSLYKNQMLGYLSSLAKAGRQKYDHTGV